MTVAAKRKKNGNAGTAEPILLRRDSAEGVTTLTLNRPDARNALSTGLIGEIQSTLDAIATDASVKVVVVAAKGSAFCAGHDLKELRANPGRQHYETLMAQCSKMMLSFNRLPQPVIAKVHAAAWAAGCQLVATCDLAVAAKSANFCTPGVNIGLFCATPMVALTRNVGRKQAMEMLLLGEAIDADTAVTYGLVNRAVDDDRLDAAVDEIAATIVGKSPLTLKIGKEAFYRQIELDIASAYDFASDAMVQNMMARDAEEGIDAFIEKRDPVWTGR
ncbi:MAG: enoyl-CoA hydratase [Pseudomonadota bacterium]